MGALAKQLLAALGITVGGYVSAIGPIEADLSAIPLAERPARAEAHPTRCPEPHAAQAMQAAIAEIIRQRDTLGGVIEIVALGVPPGLGSHVHWDRRLDARLAGAVMSVQAIKGVEIGPGFANARLPGTQVHDAIRRQGRDLVRPTNRAGGIEGGISNGQPIVVRAAMKPIATTLTPQPTVDLATGAEEPTRYERSDFCPVPRAVPVLEAMVALVLADALLEKLGGDTLAELQTRLAALRQPRLDDLPQDGSPHTFWPADSQEEAP